MEIRFLTADDAVEWLKLRVEALEREAEAFSASLEEYQSLSIEEVKRRLWSSREKHSWSARLRTVICRGWPASIATRGQRAATRDESGAFM
jgi:hypothetical protein